jgi:hypothetical protein
LTGLADLTTTFGFTVLEIPQQEALGRMELIVVDWKGVVASPQSLQGAPKVD